MSTAAASPSAAPSPAAATGHPATVVIDGLTKYFPVRRGWMETLRRPFGGAAVAAVQDVTCEVHEGEFFGLLGVNGAGKTTLFKMLATLVLPDAGTATVCGHDVVRQGAAVRRLLAPVIADERSLYWRISARQNLELYAVLQGLGGREARARAAELLEIVGLADSGAKMVGQFSSGMKQRLLIARALVAQPRVLLLDEPTRSLDPISARALRAFLREEIARRRGCTVLLATHNAEEALELCDRVAVLDRGQLLAQGTAEQLAREIGDERYRVWTTDPHHPGIAALAAQGVVRDPVDRGADDEGWSRLDVEVPGGAERASQVIAFLSAQGVAIARFERLHPTLAELIERIVARRRPSLPDPPANPASRDA